MEQRQPLNIPLLNLRSLLLWFLEFEDECEKKDLTEEEQYEHLLGQIPDDYQHNVLHVTVDSFREGHYQRLKDALIDAVNSKASDEIDYRNAHLIGTVIPSGKGQIIARNITVNVSCPPSSLPQDRPLILGHVGLKGEAQVKATEDIIIKIGDESVSISDTPKVIETSAVQAEPDAFYEMGKPGDPKRGKLPMPKPEDKQESTEKDVEALEETFEMLNFDVEVQPDK